MASLHVTEVHIQKILFIFYFETQDIYISS